MTLNIRGKMFYETYRIYHQEGQNTKQTIWNRLNVVEQLEQRCRDLKKGGHKETEQEA